MATADDGKPKYGDMRDYAGPNLFQPHQARKAIRDAHEGKIPPMLGYFAALPSVPVTRWLAPIGYDVVWIDAEHSACGVETMTSMVHDIMFISGGRTIPFVRVPGHDHAAIGFALDAGASIIVPQVETVAQAQHVVSAAKFGAAGGGTRSAPPCRLWPGLLDTPLDARRGLHLSLNDQAAIVIQIESLAGIRNLDAILTAVPEIDAVFLGTLDARVSMGLDGRLGAPADEPEWLAAIDQFRATVRKHDKPLAGGVLAQDAASLRDEAAGMSVVWIGFDVLALMGLRDRLLSGREALGDRKKA